MDDNDLKGRLNSLNARFSGVDARLEKLDMHLSRLDGRLAEIQRLLLAQGESSRASRQSAVDSRPSQSGVVSKTNLSTETVDWD